MVSGVSRECSRWAPMLFSSITVVGRGSYRSSFVVIIYYFVLLKLRGRVGLRRILTHSPICSDSYLYRIPFQTGQPDKYNFRSHDHMRLLQDKNMNCYSSLHKILQDILFIEKKRKNSFSSHLILKTLKCLFCFLIVSNLFHLLSRGGGPWVWVRVKGGGGGVRGFGYVLIKFILSLNKSLQNSYNLTSMSGYW